MENSAVPKVSVIIPLYNKAPYIKRALDSVLTQTVQDFEIVVVGGNSTDGGEEIVLGYSDSRIRFVKEAGKGVSAARNQGVDAAQAELVAFLDADDEWLPEFLETILRLREKWPEAGMYFSNSYKLIGNSRSLSKITYRQFEGVIDNYFRDCALYGHRIETSSVVVSREIFLMVNGFDSTFTFFEDYDLWDRIAFNSHIVYIDKPMAIYHIDSSNASNRISACNKLYNLPFTTYLQNQSEEVVLSRDDYSDILLYLDSLKFLSAGILIHYSKLEAIRCVSHVHSIPLLKKKYVVILSYLVPQILKKPLSKLYHTVFRNH